MRSGALRYPATIVREITVTTESGAETTAYEDVLTTRVGITTVSGREFIDGGAETMETTVKIVMRTPNHLGKRVLMGDEVRSQGRNYTVISVLDFDKQRSLQLMCKELV